MNNRIIAVLASCVLILGQVLNNVSPAQSVQFGQDAIGDPNAIDVEGSSGFLYSDRLVFTAAHVILSDGTTVEESMRRIARWEQSGSVYAPGIGDRAGLLSPDQEMTILAKMILLSWSCKRVSL